MWHAKNLQLIDPSAAGELLQQPSKPRMVFAFAEEVRPRAPVEYELELEASHLALGLASDLALRAYAEGILSRGRAEEIVSFR